MFVQTDSMAREASSQTISPARSGTAVGRDVDVYRTRGTGVSSIEPRPHPTVWGDGDRGPLSPGALSGYEGRGYHLAEGALTSEDIDACRDELAHLTLRLGDDNRIIRERSDGSIRSIFDVHKLSDVVAEICSRPQIVDVARQILDDEVYIHQSRINFKPGFAGGPFYWHSDFETWHAEDGMPAPRALSVSLALTPNRSDNGALMIVPGSHKHFMSCAGKTPDGYHAESLASYRPPVGTPDEAQVTQMAEKYGIDTVTGPAGSVLYFDSNCLHASAGNITPFPRSNLFVVFNSRANALVRPFASASPRPQYLANEVMDPQRQQVRWQNASVGRS